MADLSLSVLVLLLLELETNLPVWYSLSFNAIYSYNCILMLHSIQIDSIRHYEVCDKPRCMIPSDISYNLKFIDIWGMWDYKAGNSNITYAGRDIYF